MLNLGLSIGTIALTLLEDQEGIPVPYEVEFSSTYSYTNESGTQYVNEFGENYVVETLPYYVSEDGLQTYTTEG